MPSKSKKRITRTSSGCIGLVGFALIFVAGFLGYSYWFTSTVQVAPELEHAIQAGDFTTVHQLANKR